MSRIFRNRRDEEEFVRMAQGKVKRNFRYFLSRGRIRIPRKDGTGIVMVPITRIDIPHFRYGKPNIEIGQGEGEIGDDMGPVKKPNGKKKGSGEGRGEGDTVEIPISRDEFAHLFQTKLELPNIQPKGERMILEDVERYSSVSKIGSPSLIHIRRTMHEALKRAVADGTYRPPDKTIIVPNRNEMRYKASETIYEPKNSAVLFWARDSSGSVGEAEMEIISRVVDMTEFWLSLFYERLENVYLIHDTRAMEVNREDFLFKNLGGGTIASTMLSKVLEIAGDRFNPSDWNIYVTYFSDGVNWDEDNEKFGEMMVSRILPIVNQFNYGEVKLERSWWHDYKRSGATTFSEAGTIGDLMNILVESGLTNIAQANIEGFDHEAAINVIKKFFGKKG